ncbi:Rab GDP dissociation inhibitor [Pancytospora philotis]|nr:Rab GDP dissociation inhibitor [Pancytospora philotis]
MNRGENGAEAAEEHYDYVIIGTGLAETAVSCILAAKGKHRILHLDRNASYGNEFSTLQYTQLLQHFGQAPGPADERFVASNRDFNIDLTPKLLLQDSPMKDFLLENEIQDLVSFTSIKGSYLCTSQLHSIPTSEAKALKSSAISFMQKPRVIQFFWNVRSYVKNKEMRTKSTMREEFASFRLSADSIDFIGHAIAQNLNDDYLDRDPRETYEQIARYISSIVCYEGTESPYIYPLYGLSELCQAFARRSALFGTLFMLNADIQSISADRIRLVDPNGEPHNIVAGKIIADPRYFEDSRVAREVIRCIMVLGRDTSASRGASVARNIVFLKSQLRRKNDIFCVILGGEEMACPEQYEIGILSTIKETDDPAQEIAEVVSRFNVIRKFTETRQVLVHEDTPHVLFTRGVDESTLLDNIYDDVQRIVGLLEPSA